MTSLRQRMIGGTIRRPARWNSTYGNLPLDTKMSSWEFSSAHRMLGSAEWLPRCLAMPVSLRVKPQHWSEPHATQMLTCGTTPRALFGLWHHLRNPRTAAQILP
jgi:hypothetical protein